MAYQTTNILGSGYGNKYVDALVWGDRWVGTPITYSFNNGLALGQANPVFFGDTIGMHQRKMLLSQH